jgi:ATP/maltotriose-dependent transcriptional regulator MalT
LLELGEVKRLSALLVDPVFAREIDASIQDAIARSAIDDLRNWVSVTKYVPELGDKARLILNFYIELLSGNLKEAESNLHALRDAIEKLNAKDSIQWWTDLYALESISHYARGRLNDAFHLAMQAYQHASQQPASVRGHQISYLQLALWGAVINDDDAKVRMIDEILESEFVKVSLRHRNSVVLSMRALICAHEGRFTEARNHLVTPLTPDTKTSYAGFFGNYGVKLAESMLIGESGDVEGSLEVLRENVESAFASKNYPIAIASLGRLGYHYLLLGKTNEALECISKAREIISQEMLATELHGCVDIWEARVIYKLLDFKRTEELIKRANASYLVRAFEAAINIDTNPTKALEITETFDLRNPRQLLTYHLFRAHIFKDAPSSQLDEVKKAVEVGSKHGYFNHFLTQRSDVIQQYISLATESPTAFNERLARAAGVRLNEMMVGSDKSGESLTRREADILRHLATGLPLKDIAKNLSISKNTIKTHLRNLYRKLGAEDRKDAVEKGKRLLKV